jgi:hypothetical protein
MSLYYGNGYWGGEQYQHLTDLHLPSPALVIDVRWGNDHDPPLIWNLAIELEDLSTEMKLNEVPRSTTSLIYSNYHLLKLIQLR